MLKSHLRIAWRGIIRHKGYSLINIVGLAVGMAVCILILLWVEDEISFDRFHTDADRIYRVVSENEGEWWLSSPWAIGGVLKKDFPEILKTSRYTARSALVSYRDSNSYESVALVDPDFLSIFTFPLVRGDPRTVLEAAQSAVLTEKTARQYFRNEDPIGKSIRLNREHDMIVTGIIKDVPGNSSLSFDVLAPVQMLPKDVLDSWAVECETYVLLDKNASLPNLRTKMAGTTVKYDKRTEVKVVNDLEPLRRIHLYSLNGTGAVVYVYIFSAIALLVLVLACANFINLTTARSGKRAKEIGIKKVVGATRAALIRQFLVEAMVHTVLAFVLALLLVLLFLPSFNNLAGKNISWSIFRDARLLTAMLGVALLTGLLAGGYPALVLSMLKPIRTLRQVSATASHRSLLRRMLVAFQFTVAITLTIGAMVIHRQLDYIRNKDLGFDRLQIVTLEMNPDLLKGYESLKNELKQHANVLNVTSANNLPTGVGNINPVYWEGRGPEQYVIMNFDAVDHDYIDTFGMKIAAGRDFSEDLETDRRNYIVNEAAVRFMKLQDPVGKLFSIWENEGRIVGVVKDFHSTSLHDEIRPLVLTLNQEWQPAYVFVKIRAADVRRTLEFMESVWKRFAKNYPFEYQFLDDKFAAQYSSEERMGQLSNYFSALAILISCFGLVGLSSFMAAERTKEIGVRRALGATASSIVGLLSREFMLLVLAASAISWPVAFWAASRWLREFAYHTDIGLQAFLVSSALVVGTALLTLSYQTIRAARANPVESLRYE
ncbi:MAG: ABC transporter permease [Acidobacteriota bacterium]